MWARERQCSDFVYILLSYERIDSMYVSGDYVHFIFRGKKLITDFSVVVLSFYEVMVRPRRMDVGMHV